VTNTAKLKLGKLLLANASLLVWILSCRLTIDIHSLPTQKSHLLVILSAAADTTQKSSQEDVVKMLARACNSPTDTWDGKPWNAEPIGRYKVVFET